MKEMFSLNILQFLYLIILGEKILIKVERKIANTILRHSLSPVLQTPIFCKEFGLFVSNTFSKVPLVVLEQFGVLNKFFRIKVSISSEKWFSFSPLDPDTSIFTFPATEMLSYLLIAWLIVFDNSWKKISYDILAYLAYKWI